MVYLNDLYFLFQGLIKSSVDYMSVEHNLDSVIEYIRQHYYSLKSTGHLCMGVQLKYLGGPHHSTWNFGSSVSYYK